MRKWLLRTMAAILAVALIQPAIGTGKASAEDVTWDAQAPDLDKYEDGQLGYADGDTGFHPGMIYVGYYTEDGKDLTSTGVIRFNLPPRPAGAVIKSATLTVEVKYRSTDPSVIGDPFFKVYGASDDNWTESGTDVPFYDSVANYIGQSGGIPDEDMPPYTFDVKSFLNSEWQGATSAASFVFTGTTAANVSSTISGTDASIGFYDRNAPDQSTHAPKLQIVYAINNSPSDLSLNGNTVAENQPAGTVVGTLYANDADGDTLTYSITDGDKSDFQIVGDKLQTAAPFNYEAKDSYSLKIEAADPYGGAIAEVFTVSVTDVNEAPADITLTNASIAENEPAGTAIGQLNGVNDPDQTPGTYSYSIEPGLDGGSFKIDGTELQSNASFNYESKKQYQVNVKVTDGSASFTKTFTIAVTNVNEAPTNVTLSMTNIDEGLPAGTEVGTLTGTDPDTSETLTYSVEGTDKDAFKIVGNSFQSNQTFNFKTKSSYSIQLKVTDAGGLSFTSSPITISVNDVNDTPTGITLSGTSVNENEAIGTTIGTLDAVDPDDSTPYSFDIMSVSGGGSGKFAIEGSVLKTNAIFDHETPPTAYDVEIQVTDAGGAKFKKTFAINVNDVNEAPTGLNLTGTSVDENKPENTVVGTLSAVDPDAGDSLTYKITGGADESSFGIDGDKLVTKGPFDYENAKAGYEVKIQVSDKSGLSNEKTFTVSVNDVNEEPTNISLTGDSVDENKPIATLVGTLSANDPDAGDTFSYAIVGGKDASKFQISGSSLQTAAQLDYEAQKSYEVIIQVTDSASNTYEKTFTITVTDVNESPTGISLSPSAVDEGLPADTTVGTLSATDPDAGDAFQYAIVGTDGNFEIVDDSLMTKVEFDKEDKSSYSIQIKVTDSGSLSYTKTITVTIGDVNEKPTDLTLSDTNVDENQAAGTAVGTLAAVDPDAGDTFTYAIDDATGTLPFDIAGNSLRTTDVLDYETKNSYDVPVTVTDSGGLTFSKTFVIHVQNANDAPTDIALSATSVAEDKPIGTEIGALSVTDPDSGGTYRYAIESGPDADQFSISDSDLITNAVFDYETKTSYSIDVRVIDGAESYVKTLTIAVADINEAPTALTLSNSAIDENLQIGSTIGTLNAKDPDAGDAIDYSIINVDDAASFTIDDNTLLTAESFDYESKNIYNVKVKATDHAGLSYELSFAITVIDVNDAPTAISIDHGTIDENQPAGTSIGALSTVDQDTGDTFTYEIVGGEDASVLSIDGATATLKSADAFDYETKNVLNVDIKVTDATGASFTQTLPIAVRNVNEAPAASDQSLETRGGRPIDGQLAAIDPEHDALTYAIVDQPAKGDLTLDAATGKFTFKPQAGNYEEVTFTFKANDGALDSNVATVTVTNRQETGGGGTPPKKPDVSVDDIGGAGGVIASFDDEDSNRLHISFDRNALQNLPADMKTFTLHLNDQLESVDIAIDPWLFDQLSERDIVLTVETSLGVLSLPKSAWALAGKDTLTVTLESAPSAATKGLHVVGKPVSVQLKKDGAPITAPLDTGFLTLQLPVSGNRPTTAVRLLANGGYQPVPSLIVKDDDGYSVQVSSRAGGTFALVSETAHFSDTSGWSQPYIDELASRLIVNGVGEDKFEPNRGVTRAEFAKIVVQALDLISGTPTGGFKDTNPTAWYADSVGTAVQLGLFSGYPDGTFHPAQAISRQEAFAVLSRALKLAEVDSVFSDADRAEALGSFSDSANMQDWAQEALAASQLLGLVHDEGTEFHPTAPMTREQLCYSVVQLLRAGGLIEQD